MISRVNLFKKLSPLNNVYVLSNKVGYLISKGKLKPTKYSPIKLSQNSINFHFASIKKSHLINPYNKQFVSDKQYISDQNLQQRITKVTEQQDLWKQIPLQTRIQRVTELLNAILDDQIMLRDKIAQEIGKSYKDIHKEFEQLRHQAPSLLNASKQALKTDDIKQLNKGIVRISQEPIGLALLFPHFSQPIFDTLIHLIPCLISGCGALIKASDYNHFLGPYIQKKSLEILKFDIVADLFFQPEDLYKVSQFRSLKKIVYSGSHSSAKHIFQVMAQKRFIDCNMFFGGQDAAYIDETAHIKSSVKQIIQSAYGNNGQSYDCIKRLYINKNVYEQVINQMKDHVLQLKQGNPKDQTTDMGPLAIPIAASGLQELITQAISLGAICQIGGMSTSDETGLGIFFQPTLLSQVSCDMSILQTQTPAPILCCFNIQSQQQFITSVNDNRYGSGVQIFTQQIEPIKILSKYQNLIRKLEVGKIVFNKGSLFTNNRRVESWRVSSLDRKLSSNSYEEFTISKVFDIQDNSK